MTYMMDPHGYKPRCPKCSGVFSEPKFQQDYKGERLEYWCTRCGYKKETPCHDANRIDQ